MVFSEESSLGRTSSEQSGAERVRAWLITSVLKAVPLYSEEEDMVKRSEHS